MLMWNVLFSRRILPISGKENVFAILSNLFDLKMTSAEVIKRLESKANAAEQMITFLKSEVENLRKNQSARKPVNQTSKLALENESLRTEIEKYKNELIRLEIENGIKQVPIKCSKTESLGLESRPAEPSPVKTAPATEPAAVSSEKKDKKPKKEKPASGEKKGADSKVPEEPPVDVGRLDFRVGKIINAKKHPDADALYVEEIDVGEDKNRTVVSGLVKYVPVEELQNKLVVLLCNLKPVKMRGITSEAMVMCASTADKVEVLNPPPGVVPGDLVHVEGYPRVPDSILNPKKKVFETCAPDLKTDDQKQAVYKGVPLQVPGKGPVTAPNLAGVQVK